MQRRGLARIKCGILVFHLHVRIQVLYLCGFTGHPPAQVSARACCTGSSGVVLMHDDLCCCRGKMRTHTIPPWSTPCKAAFPSHVDLCGLCRLMCGTTGHLALPTAMIMIMVITRSVAVMHGQDLPLPVWAHRASSAT